ncbi:MAG: hypothetical protein HZB51_20605 [Chloroflexi bacterium]|nr:hypothetical protein [Chloroflexota bacterium]
MNTDRNVEELVAASIQFERNGQMGDALERAYMALEHARMNADAESIASAFVRAGEVHYRMGHYGEAQMCAEQALKHAGEKSHARADALNTLGNCAMEIGSLADVESFHLRAADLYRELGDDDRRLGALHNLGAGVYALRGQFDLALATYDEAYRVACQLNSPKQAVTLIAKTFIHLQMGQLQHARATVEKLGLVASAAKVYQGYYLCMRAFLAMDERDLSAASTFFAQSRSVAEQIGDPALNIFIRMGQSQYHRILGNAPAALEWANDALAWASRARNRRMLGRTLIERALTTWLLDDRRAAENDLREAIRELSARGQSYDLARAQFLFAALLHAQNHTDTESAWLDAATQIVRGGYAYILDQDRSLAYPLIASYPNCANSAVAEISAQCVEHLQRVPPSPLRIVTLGAFEVWQGARQLDRRALHKRRAGDLVMLLLLAPTHSLTFDQIADALWNDKDRAAAQSLFHQATSALRHALEPELPDKFTSRYVHVEEGCVTLDLPPGSTIDFQIFEEHCNKEEWQAALEIYRGDLFPDHLYADWAVTARERFKRLYLRALLITAHRQMQAGHARETMDACHRILEIDPWQEDAVLLGMQACLAFNDRAGALHLYRELERTLREELNTMPQAALRELYESVISEQ